jgi:hypothetical protein
MMKRATVTNEECMKIYKFGVKAYAISRVPFWSSVGMVIDMMALRPEERLRCIDKIHNILWEKRREVPFVVDMPSNANMGG